MFKLTRFFSIVSAIIMSAVTVVLAVAYKVTELNRLVADAQSRNVAISRSIANAMSDEMTRQINLGSGRTPAEIRADPSTEVWHQKMARAIEGLPILKLKLYSRDGITVYSSEFDQIGKGPSSPGPFVRVIDSGATHSNFEFRPKFQAFFGVVEDRYVVSSYVAIYDADKRVSGVLESYSDVTPEYATISRRIWQIVATIAAAFGLLYVVLYLAVRGADGVLARQRNELAALNGTLEMRVKERTHAVSYTHLTLPTKA